MTENETKQTLLDKGPQLLLLFFCSAYAVIMTNLINTAYIDFGDGNYLYISRRVTEGITLYRDILTPQPPVHLFIGAGLLRLGDLFGNPLFIIRIYSILLHIGTAVAIYFLGRKITGSKWGGSLSGVIFLLLPIGFSWARGYQTEPLVIFLMVIWTCLLMDFRKPHIYYATIPAVIAGFTNMTFQPYLQISFIFVLILAIRRKDYRLFLGYFLPVALAGLIITGLTQWYSSGYFLKNAFFDQVGSFPAENLGSYIAKKLVTEGKDIFHLEGGAIILSVIGFVYWVIKDEGPRDRRYYLFMYYILSLCSILYVSKGGTVDYIFSIAEPVLAIFTAFLVLRITTGIWSWSTEDKPTIRGHLQRGLAVGAIIGMILSPLGTGLKYISLLVFEEQNLELTSAEINVVVEKYIEKYSNEGDEILAPPFYAFISDRRVLSDFSETYIWYIKYLHKVKYDQGSDEVLEFMDALATRIKNKEAPLLLLNMRMARFIPPLLEAARKNYISIGRLQTTSEDIIIMIPAQEKKAS